MSAASDPLLLGFSWLASPYTHGDKVEASAYLRLARWAISTVNLGPPWREGHPWVVQLREATTRGLAASAVIQWNQYAVMDFFPELAPGAAPYWVELLPQDGYGELSLFIPLIRCAADRKPILFQDPTERLKVVLI